MGTKFIHLVRHGQYHMEKDHENYGQLTELGHEQSRYTAKRLKDYSFEVLRTSTMLRALDTARSIKKHIILPNEIRSHLLVEGIPVFPSSLVAKRKLKKTKLTLTKSRMNRAYLKFFTPYKKSGERHELIICHGNIIRYFVTKALKIKPIKWIDFDIQQCSLTTIRIEDTGEIKLITFGEIGHIPLKMRTYI